MKNYNLLGFLSIFIMSLAAFYGCQKEVLTTTPESIIEPLSKLDNIRVSVKDGVLHFEENDQYFDAVETITNASPDQLTIWEQKLGFRSLRAITEKLEEEAGEIEDDSDYNDFVQNNHDFIRFTRNKDGVEPVIGHPYYAAVSNEKGIFYVGKSVYKVFPEKVIESRDGDLKKLSRAGNLEENLIDENVFVYKTKQETSSRYPCSNPNNAYRERSDGKRKVDLSVYLGTHYCAGKYNVQVITNVKGYKKPRRRWNSYRTYLRYECGSATVNINGTNYNIGTWAGNTSSDSKSLQRNVWVNHGLLYNSPSIYFVNTKARASSRGISHLWAVVCCGPNSNSCPSNTGVSGLCN